MSDAIITVEGLGKRYRIHHEAREPYTTMRDTLARRAKSLFMRAAGNPKTASSDEDFWALQDVSFEIKQGEVVGIIGRNGAGKSTLLKILSRITEPTKGRITLRGRVASLLEVGTGFHPELTGRENIFLNGAILGMSRAEIRSKFDEIVGFAEVEKFLDTPVKRYSSGMYVRLAFAVAAHLEPEILIVDEVLAVGDAEFQKKCLGKMQDVASHEGRTVLFVSHNIAAISSLTRKAMLLVGGRISIFSDTEETLKIYHANKHSAHERTSIPGKGVHTKILSIKLLDAENRELSHYVPAQSIRVAIEFQTDGTPGLSVELILLDPSEERVGIYSLYQFHGQCLPTRQGVYRFEILLSGLWLAAGSYSLEVATSVANHSWDHRVERAFDFDVHFSNPEGRSWDFRHSLGFGSLALRSEGAPLFSPICPVQTENPP